MSGLSHSGWVKPFSVDWPWEVRAPGLDAPHRPAARLRRVATTARIRPTHRSPPRNSGKPRTLSNPGFSRGEQFTKPGQQSLRSCNSRRQVPSFPRLSRRNAREQPGSTGNISTPPTESERSVVGRTEKPYPQSIALNDRILIRTAKCVGRSTFRWTRPASARTRQRSRDGPLGGFCGGRRLRFPSSRVGNQVQHLRLSPAFSISDLEAVAGSHPKDVAAELRQGPLGTRPAHLGGS